MVLLVLLAQQQLLLLLHVRVELCVVSAAAVLAVERARGGVVLVLVRRHGGAHRVVGCWGRRRRGRAGDGGREMRLLVHLGHGHCFVVVGVDDAGGWRRGGGRRGGRVDGHRRRRGRWLGGGRVLAEKCLSVTLNIYLTAERCGGVFAVPQTGGHPPAKRGNT